MGISVSTCATENLLRWRSNLVFGSERFSEFKSEKLLSGIAIMVTVSTGNVLTVSAANTEAGVPQEQPMGHMAAWRLFLTSSCLFL